MVASERARGGKGMFHRKRLRFTLLVSAGFGFLFGLADWGPGILAMVARTVLFGLALMVVFGVFERWPKRLPRWLSRWVLQVVAVGLVVPPTAAIVCALLNPPGSPAFYQVPQYQKAFYTMTTFGLLLAPWFALGAVVRQKEALAHHQALEFELTRSQLERQAADARLRLLQAQVAPHFLFNTLANVQALVDAGSPQASVVLRSLIAYLRAAVPRLNEPATTFEHERQLVQAYLELMHMRMPDRLQFTLDVDDEARSLRCPPMTLLTLVENAVRHGIDPSEEGGRIDIRVQRRGDRCLVRVSDTGAGLAASNGGLGTGLTTLRERLELAFGGNVDLRVTAQHPKGVSAELEIPARESET